MVKKLASLLAHHLSNSIREAKKQTVESSAYMKVTLTITPLESSCLAICSPLQESVHCCLFFVQFVQEAIL